MGEEGGGHEGRGGPGLLKTEENKRGTYSKVTRMIMLRPRQKRHHAFHNKGRMRLTVASASRGQIVKRENIINIMIK